MRRLFHVTDLHLLVSIHENNNDLNIRTWVTAYFRVELTQMANESCNLIPSKIKLVGKQKLFYSKEQQTTYCTKHKFNEFNEANVPDQMRKLATQSDN
jgi:hypothetical protein